MIIFSDFQMVTVKLYTRHEKLSFRFKSSTLRFQNLKRQFRISLELTSKPRKQIPLKYSQSRITSLQSSAG